MTTTTTSREQKTYFLFGSLFYFEKKKKKSFEICLKNEIKKKQMQLCKLDKGIEEKRKIKEGDQTDVKMEFKKRKKKRSPILEIVGSTRAHTQLPSVAGNWNLLFVYFFFQLFLSID